MTTISRHPAVEGDQNREGAKESAQGLMDQHIPTSYNADFSLVIDRDMCIVNCNSGFAEWLGLADPNQLRGVPLAETLDPSSRSKFENLRDQIAKGHSLSVEWNHLGADGLPKLAHYHLFPPETLLQEQHHLVAIGSNRQAEMNLLEEVIDLKRERETQLAAARDLARQLELQNADLRAISHMIHHDVSNELNTISLICTLQERQTAIDLETVQRGSADIRRLCQHISGILKDFLCLTDLSRQQSHPEHIHLIGEVRSIFEVIAANQPNVPARLEMQFNALQVWVPPEHIRQILINLLTNAFKYHNPDQPELLIRLASRLEGQRVHLEITDNGIGIPDDLQATIFDLFTRAHQQGEGQGVGLAIVERLVEVNRGTVSLRSRPGEGSTFFIDLPAGPD